MSITYINLSDVSRLRNGIDPNSVWFTDEELRHIIGVSGCILERAVVRCFLGIQQKAEMLPDEKIKSDSIIWARNMLHRFEAGVLMI